MIFEFRFLIHHNYATLRRRTPIFRFLRIVWPELSDENRKNNFPRFYKISVLSRFEANTSTNIKINKNLKKNLFILSSSQNWPQKSWSLLKRKIKIIHIYLWISCWCWYQRNAEIEFKTKIRTYELHPTNSSFEFLTN